MKTRYEKAKQCLDCMLTIQQLLNVFGEIKNGRGYRSGKMGDYNKTNLWDRITNVLTKSEQMGIRTEYLLELAIDDTLPLPDLCCEKLVQYSVIAEFRYRMWAMALGSTAYKDMNTGDLKWMIGSYKFAKRLMFSRYKRVSDDLIRELLPVNFKLP